MMNGGVTFVFVAGSCGCGFGRGRGDVRGGRA